MNIPKPSENVRINVKDTFAIYISKSLMILEYFKVVSLYDLLAGSTELSLSARGPVKTIHESRACRTMMSTF